MDSNDLRRKYWPSSKPTGRVRRLGQNEFVLVFDVGDAVLSDVGRMGVDAAHFTAIRSGALTG